MTYFRTVVVALAVIASPALAQAADPVVEAARASGIVGEQADGYLGTSRAGAAADLKARIDGINIQRRALYAETASAKTGVTAADVGAAAACQQFRGRVALGHYYRDQSSSWHQRTSAAPVIMPSFCG